MPLTILDGPLLAFFNLKLRRKVIGRLPELEAVNGSKQGHLRLIVEIVIYNGACSKLVNTVAQTLAYDKALKVAEHRANGLRVKGFRRSDNREWHPSHGMASK